METDMKRRKGNQRVHQRTLTWVGGRFDPAHLNLGSVNETPSFIAARRLR